MNKGCKSGKSLTATFFNAVRPKTVVLEFSYASLSRSCHALRLIKEDEQPQSGQKYDVPIKEGGPQVPALRIIFINKRRFLFANHKKIRKTEGMGGDKETNRKPMTQTGWGEGKRGSWLERKRKTGKVDMNTKERFHSEKLDKAQRRFR